MIALFYFTVLVGAARADEYTSQLDSILSKGVKDRVYPGVAAMAGSIDGSIDYSFAFGSYRYPTDFDDDIENREIQLNSIFDIASVSKVVGGTSAIALLYEKGYLYLDTKVKDILGDKFAQGGKENVTVLNCLLHNAGFNPDPIPWYWETDFGCPNTYDVYPVEDMSCLDKIYDSFLSEELVALPGQIFHYSDLSFITLSLVVGTIARQNNLIQHDDMSVSCLQNKSLSEMAELLCTFEAFVRINVFHMQPFLPKSFVPLMGGTQFVVPEAQWEACVPTINDTVYAHKRFQGQVSDGNTYAMGGVSGHAGIFSTVQDMSRLATNLLASVLKRDDYKGSFLLNSTTLGLFTKQYNSSQSSRALGWDTNSYEIEDFGYDNSCGSLSPSTFMHIGYTGTSICIDPELRVWSVILTNRVYGCTGQSCPTPGNPGSSDAVKSIYKQFNSVLQKAVLDTSRIRAAPVISKSPL